MKVLKCKRSLQSMSMLCTINFILSLFLLRLFFSPLALMFILCIFLLLVSLPNERVIIYMYNWYLDKWNYVSVHLQPFSTKIHLIYLILTKVKSIVHSLVLTIFYVLKSFYLILWLPQLTRISLLILLIIVRLLVPWSYLFHH